VSPITVLPHLKNLTVPSQSNENRDLSSATCDVAVRRSLVIVERLGFAAESRGGRNAWGDDSVGDVGGGWCEWMNIPGICA